MNASARPAPPSFLRTLSLLLMTAAVAACSSTTESTPGGGETRGTAKKGEACSAAIDCAEPAATCRRGNVCTGPIDATAFTTECATGTAASCAGLSCIVLKANKQEKTGLCSMPCAADADCLTGNVCISLGGASGSVCVKTCATATDCNGFACLQDPSSTDSTRKACLAEPS